MHIRTHAGTRTHAHAHMHTRTQTHTTHTHTHTQTHTHIHTKTNTHKHLHVAHFLGEGRRNKFLLDCKIQSQRKGKKRKSHAKRRFMSTTWLRSPPKAGATFWDCRNTEMLTNSLRFRVAGDVSSGQKKYCDILCKIGKYAGDVSSGQKKYCDVQGDRAHLTESND